MKLLFAMLFTRRLWIKVHTWLALLLGLLFVITGLTGSLSVYRDEIDALLNPQLQVAAGGAKMLAPDKLIAAVRAAHPDRHGVWTLEMPRTTDGAVIAWFDKPRESVDAFYAPLMVAVNPYTAEVLESRFWGQTFVTWMDDVHTHLQMGVAGRNSLAVLAVFLCVSVVSGVYLWWPGWHGLSSAFMPQSAQGVRRWLSDWHKISGFLAAVPLMVLAFTGFHLAYPALLETLTASSGMGHGDEGPNVHSSAVPNDRPVSLAEAVLVARGLFPSSEIRRISTPLGETGTYRINLRQRGEINQHHPITTVWVDRWSGQIRDVRNPVRFSVGQNFTAWLWPVHTGEAWGEWGRFLWFLTGLMPLFLYVSGLWCWLCRRGLIKDRALQNRVNRQSLQRWLVRGHVASVWLIQHIKYWVPVVSRHVWRLLDKWLNP